MIRARERPGAGLVEGDVGDVGDLGGARVVGGGLGPEGGLGGEVLDPRREGADRLAVHSPAGGGVDRDLGVGDLVVRGGEDAEGEAVGAEVEVARPPARPRGPAPRARRGGPGGGSCPSPRGTSARRAPGGCGCPCRCPSRRSRRRARTATRRRRGGEGLPGHGRHRSWGTDRVTPRSALRVAPRRPASEGGDVGGEGGADHGWFERHRVGDRPRARRGRLRADGLGPAAGQARGGGRGSALRRAGRAERAGEHGRRGEPAGRWSPRTRSATGGSTC